MTMFQCSLKVLIFVTIFEHYFMDNPFIRLCFSRFQFGRGFCYRKSILFFVTLNRIYVHRVFKGHTEIAFSFKTFRFT